MDGLPTKDDIRAEQSAALIRKELTERLLENRVLRDAFDGLTARYIARWKAATTTDEREREWYTLRALEDVRIELRRFITDGDVAQDQLKRAEIAAR